MKDLEIVEGIEQYITEKKNRRREGTFSTKVFSLPTSDTDGYISGFPRDIEDRNDYTTLVRLVYKKEGEVIIPVELVYLSEFDSYAESYSVRIEKVEGYEHRYQSIEDMPRHFEIHDKVAVIYNRLCPGYLRELHIPTAYVSYPDAHHYMVGEWSYTDYKEVERFQEDQERIYRTISAIDKITNDGAEIPYWDFSRFTADRDEVLRWRHYVKMTADEIAML